MDVGMSSFLACVGGVHQLARRHHNRKSQNARGEPDGQICGFTLVPLDAAHLASGSRRSSREYNAQPKISDNLKHLLSGRETTPSAISQKSGR